MPNSVQIQRVALLDNDENVHYLFGALLSRINNALNLESYREPQAALKSITNTCPAIIFLASSIADLSGAQVVHLLKTASPDTAVVIYSAVNDYEQVLSCFLAGAVGYLRKPAMHGALKTAILRVSLGRYSFPPEMNHALLKALQTAALDSAQAGSLSARERDVIACLARGLQDKEIANRLHLAPGTVHRHVSAILEKFGAHKRDEVVRQYLGIGIKQSTG